MNHFERDFEAKFPEIRKRIGAFLFRLFPPMRVAGMRGSMPCWVQTGRALFDVGGWIPLKVAFQQWDVDTLPPAALVIGIELKQTSNYHSSLRIVGDDGSGSGLQAHQLEALAAVHRDGGIARVLWNNGGDIAVLDGPEIVQAHFVYGVSVQAEKMKKKPALGARSIPWRLFRRVNFNDHPEEIIIAPPQPLTIADEAKLKRKKEAKQIDEAERDTEAAANLVADIFIDPQDEV